ncbi:MAG: hypothetical protein C3F14_03230 [Deltaproteobacteria bacterium]|nr:MAG: hypothetical protein C3F14_03230 [Deltaproteobacteria bacterium]
MKATGLGLFLTAFLWMVPAPADCSFTYTDIHPSGWTESHAVCVNGTGGVVGYGTAESGERGFFWKSGAFSEILPPGASSARATWINSRGEVSGTAVIGGVRRAFLYRDGVYLDPTPGWVFSEAAHVAEDGAVGGTGEFGGYISRNGVTELLPGFTRVVGANLAGQVLGSAENTVRLFLPGVGYIPIHPPGTTATVPGGLNDSGLAAVSSRQGDSEEGFVYSGGFYVFMTPPGWSSSNAMAINNNAQVVGYGLSPAGRRSFLRSGPAYQEISFPGWKATEAVSVNDPGQVAGSGETATGERHAFVASPAVSNGTGEPAGAASGDAAGGGGCSMASTGYAAHRPTSWANLIVLFLPLLFPLCLRYMTSSPVQSRQCSFLGRGVNFLSSEDQIGKP